MDTIKQTDMKEKSKNDVPQKNTKTSQIKLRSRNLIIVIKIRSVKLVTHS